MTHASAHHAADAAALQHLQQIEALLRAAAPARALEQARPLFADAAFPAWRRAELCALAAEAAQALGLDDAAEALWRQAAMQASTADAIADALANLGALLARQRRHADAEAAHRDALAWAPDHVVALANLAVLAAATGRAAEAETLSRRVLTLDPGNAETHANLGLLLAAARRHEEAEQHYRTALALTPDAAATHTNLGLLLHETRRKPEAEPHLRRALELAPESAEVHSNLGNLLAALDRFDEAEALLRRALALDPDWAPAHNNLGVLLADLRRDEAAEAHFRRALDLRPDYPLARLDLSCLLLAQGRYAEGWRLHEARHDPALPDNGIPPPNLPLPRWQGEPLRGQRVLVWPEQGLGDQIQFSRYVPALKALGAAQVTVVCQRPLQALFRTLPGADAVIAADIVDNAFHIDPAEIARHDAWTFPLSVPALVGTRVETLPEVVLPYLSAPSDRLAAWRARIRPEPTTLAVGLVWRGNPLHHNDAERSLPSLDALVPLGAVPSVRFFSLQAGSAGAPARTPPAGWPVQHLGDALTDFADTAAALAALDLLICVDTSIAHLAGAMAVPCWVLLPRYRTDWRWLQERDDSPWYPGMRLFRQAQRGDWTGVISRVRDALTRLASEIGTAPP